MFETNEIHMANAQLRRGRAHDLATLANLAETGHVDGPWACARGVVTGPSGLRALFAGDELSVIAPALYSARLAPRGAGAARVIIRMDVSACDLDDLAVYVRGIDTAITAERHEWEPQVPVGSAAVRDNATALGVELAADTAKRDGRYLASL